MTNPSANPEKHKDEIDKVNNDIELTYDFVMQSEKLKRNKLGNYPDPEKEKQILKTKKTTKTQTKTSTKLKTKLNNKEKAANVENEDIDVEKDDALIEMTRGEPDYSLLGARPKTKGNLVATKGKEFEMIDHEKTRANGSEAAEKREKFEKISVETIITDWWRK